MKQIVKKQIVLAACLLLLMVACKRDDRAQGTSDEPTPPPASADAAAPDPDAAQVPGDRERPNLRVQTLDGDSYDLADRRGKWVVINFWATWCPPCLKEMPELSALDAMREHIEVIGLAYEEIAPADLKAFLAKRPVVYPVAIIDVANPPRDFDTPSGLPVTYLVAPDGRVAKRFLGPVTAQQLETAIAAAGGPALQEGSRG